MSSKIVDLLRNDHLYPAKAIGKQVGKFLMALLVKSLQDSLVKMVNLVPTVRQRGGQGDPLPKGAPVQRGED
jgi:hypothetical protein